MSSTPEEGEDGAPEDIIDLPEEAHDVRETGRESKAVDGPDIVKGDNDTGVDTSSAVNNVGDAEIGNLDESLILDDPTTKTIRNDLEAEVRSDEETISVPDDTPSIQVRLSSVSFMGVLIFAGFCAIIQTQRSTLLEYPWFSSKSEQSASTLRTQIPIPPLRLASG